MRIVPRLLFLVLLFVSSLFVVQDVLCQENTAAPATADSSKKVKKPRDPSDTTKKIKLFKEQKPLLLSISTDMRELIGEKEKSEFQKAQVELKLPDGTTYKESIELRTRGNFRKEYCYVPSLMLNFESVKGNSLEKLEKLKMVSSCRLGKEFDQLVLKEYLTYKIFNLLTDTSYRVRLMQVFFNDTEGKRKPYSSWGFLIEDVDDMAKRNGCREIEVKKLHTELTDRKYMTLVAMFQYMIGNTDWSVPGDHNIKLIQKRDSTNSKPLAVPYDFDYCGLVNASYAVPPEELGIASVRDRLYRGFPRNMAEIEESAKVFRDKKPQIISLIQGMESLEKREKDDMVKYLEDFYRVISDPKQMQREFIDNARSL